jgi:hypothetical protein
LKGKGKEKLMKQKIREKSLNKRKIDLIKNKMN